MKKICFLAMVATLLTGCSSAIEQQRYSLVDDISPSALDFHDRVNVTMAGALNEPGLVLRLSPVTVQAAKYHLWDMALSDQLAVLVNEEMMQTGVKVGKPVHAYVSRFDGTLDGVVTVAVAFKTQISDARMLTKSYMWTGKQTRDGYESLVETLRDGFKKVAGEFVHELKAHE